MSQMEDAAELQALTVHPGWRHFEDIRLGIEKSAEDELLGMFSRPDSLTGKRAIRLASRREAMRDLSEEIESKLKILLPTPRGGA